MRQPSFGASLPLEKRGDYIRMDWNECPYPPCPGVVEAVKSVAGRVNEYAPSDHSKITGKLGGLWKVPPECIAMFAGAHSALHFSFLTRIGALAGWTEPNYGYLEAFTDAAGQSLMVTRNGLSSNISHLNYIAEKCSVVYVSNPMAQTGLTYASNDVWKLAKDRFGTLFIIDETYAEFSGDSILFHALLPNVIVVRSMSKAYSLAGLRVGYAISGNRDTVAFMRKMSGPEELSLPAYVAALAALDDLPYMISSVDAMVFEALRIGSALTVAGIRNVAGETNFVAAQFNSAEDSGSFANYMLGDHILVRRIPDFPELVRITVRSTVETGAFIKGVEAWSDRK